MFGQRLFFALVFLTLSASTPRAAETEVRLRVVQDDGRHLDVRLEMRRDRPGRGEPSATLAAFTADLSFDREVLEFVGRTSSGLEGEGYVLTTRLVDGRLRIGAHGVGVGKGREGGAEVRTTFDGDVATLRFRVRRSRTPAPFVFSTLETSYFSTTSNRPAGLAVDVPAVGAELYDPPAPGPQLVTVTREVGAGWAMVAPPVDARQSPPFVGPTYSSWIGTVTVGGIPGGRYPSGEPTILAYDESSPGAFWDGYAPPASMSARLAPGQGVLLKAVAPDGGDLKPGRTGGTLSARVQPLQEAWEYDLSFTPTGRGGRVATASDGWNLLGNPYPEPVSWTESFRGTGIGETIYVIDAETGRYLYYNRALRTGTLRGGVIEPFQAFWVTTLRPGATLTVSPPGQESKRATSAPVAMASLQAPVGSVDADAAEGLPLRAQIELRVSSDADSTAGGLAQVVLDPDAGLGVDSLDTYWLGSPEPSLAALYTSAPDGSRLSIQARPHGGGDVAIPLHVETASRDALRLTWPSLEGVPADWGVRLLDTATGQSVDLRTAQDYAFRDLSASTEAPPEAPGPASPLPSPIESGGAARFVLSITTGGTDAPPAVTSIDRVFPNPASSFATAEFTLAERAAVTLDVYDALGRRALRTAVGERGVGSYRVTLDLDGLASGVYLVRLADEAGTLLDARRLTVAR